MSLVLSRKPGETIVLTGGIEFRVQQVKGNRVTVGIDAPEDVKIMRGELRSHNEDNPQKPPGKAA